MFRTQSKGPGHLALKELSTGTFGDDGRFKIRFHNDLLSLATWYRRQQVNRSPTAPLAEENIEDIPRLNIAIHVVGSRGDVQPFIPIAKLLTEPPFGHRVRICTHPAFKDFVESQGIEFFNIGGDPEALMAYMVKNPGLLPNRQSVKAGDVAKRRQEMSEIMNCAWRSCIEAGNGMGEPIKAAYVANPKDLFIADTIIANPPSMAHIHCAEKLGIPLHMVFTMPWSPTEAFSHPLAAMNYGGADKKIANYLSFIMMELLTWQGLGDLINKFRRQKLALDPISPMWGFHLLPRLRVPFTYLWSNSLIPKPGDWGSHINIAGFSFLSLANSYTPPEDLTAFLEAGPPPIYIGFGSIVVDDTEALTRLLLEAVSKAGVRALISKGWSKVGGDDLPDDVYLIGNCPHDWLFQRVSAVVHHGGAGTTAAGIAWGCPTVVVPFFGDQPFWGQMIARAGAGPEPVPFTEMTADSLAESITFALKPEVKAGAQKMAESIGQETGSEDATKAFLERLVRDDDLRCEICPERLASWVHKKSGMHLSGFAVSCLMDQGLVRPHEIKLLQHRNWYVDEGAEHPLIGIAATVSGFFMSVAVATSDYSKALKSRPKPSSRRRSSTAGQNAVNTKPVQERRSGTEEAPNPGTHEGLIGDAIGSKSFTPKEMEVTAKKMAKKSLRSVTPPEQLAKDGPSLHDKGKAVWRSRESGRHGRLYYVTRKTGRYAAELSKAGLKLPVAFFWNTANGFHNYPSYGFAGVEVRRRDPITGLGSGFKAAGKEFVLGFWDAFVGAVSDPYRTIRDEGAKGIGKGIWRGGRGFFSNIGAAVYGLPGYSLKGLEKGLSKRHLTKLKAEIILIRMRTAIDDFRSSTPEERAAVVEAWKSRC